MDNKIIITILIIGIFLTGGYLFFNTNGAVVSAQGESVIKVEPDIVSININVLTKAKIAEEAKAEHNRITDELFISLLRTGLERKDIQTRNFNIYPDYEWENGKREDQGFVVNQNFIVETEDFDLTADIIDAAINSGALVSYINFELSVEKQSDYKTYALEQAGKDAKKKAEATARGLGKNLGRLVSIKNQDFNYYPYRYFEATDSIGVGGGILEAKEAALNINPSDLEIRASVIVEYKIGLF